MKNFNFYLVGIIIALTFASAKLNAQLACPYPIFNNLNCDIVIGYEFLDANCNEICGPTQFTVTPGSNNIPCCQGAVYISIHIRNVNYQGACVWPGDVSCPTNVVSDCPTINLNYATFVDCSGSANNSIINFSSSGSTIN